MFSVLFVLVSSIRLSLKTTLLLRVHEIDYSFSSTTREKIASVLVGHFNLIVKTNESIVDVYYERNSIYN